MKKEQWSSNIGFLLATAGSAIGLGNVWKFPYITGENGGGAFVLVYLVCIACIGFPLMVCEFSLGRATRQGAVGAFRTFSRDRNTPLSMLLSGLLVLIGALLLSFQYWGYGVLAVAAGIILGVWGWKVVGAVVGVISPGLIASYYCVIGGWTLIYFFKAIAGELNFQDPKVAEEVLAPIVSSDPSMMPAQIVAFFIFIVLTAVALLYGVRRGIERFSKILMPLLFLLLLLLVVRGMALPGAMEGVRFFLQPKLGNLHMESVLVALGHAFFTLSLAMGISITYGSYMRKDQNVVKSALAVIGLDTMAAMMAGLAIFPALFAMGFAPDKGVGLAFMAVPAAFSKIPGGLGWLWNGAFFLALFIAALTSAISILEALVNCCINEWKLSRRVAVLCSCVSTVLLGFLSLFSISNWDRLPWLKSLLVRCFGEANNSWMDLIDSFTSNWLLPLGGLFTVLFVGWIWTTRRAVREMRFGAGTSLDTNLWALFAGLHRDPLYQEPRPRFTFAMMFGLFVRWITPILTALVFLYSVGVLRFS